MAKNWKNACKKIFNKDQLSQEAEDFHSTYRLLLLGTKESGKTSIMKQMRILYGPGFTTMERLGFVADVRRNLRAAISQLVKAFVTLDSVIPLDCCENQEYLDYICNMNGFLLTDEGLELYAGNVDYKEDGPSQYPPEFWKAAELLWNDEGFRKLYSRRSEFGLLDSGKYFLDRLTDIQQSTYVPSEQDVLRVRIESAKSMETTFTVDGVRYTLDDLCRMFDVAGQRDQKGKWLQCFNNINAIIFLIPTSGFDLPATNSEGSHGNRLSESLATFAMLWNSKWLTRKSVIVFLNKVDQLKEKINSGCGKFEEAFPDFVNYSTPSFASSSNGESAEFTRAKYFIRNELTKITSASNTQHVCYPHFCSAIETENIARVFNDCREIIQRTQLQMTAL